MDNELKEILLNMQDHIVGLYGRIDNLDGRMDKLDSRMDKLDNRMDKLDSRMDTLEQDVRDIKLTIENDINRKISVLYDAHVDSLRYRQELIKVIDKVDNHEMRIDNLEKAYSS